MRIQLAAVALGLVGCAAAARPSATKYTEVTGGESCALVEDRNEPFVVDWRADKRGDLEAALGKGVVVVAYDCKKLRILSDCAVEGSYAFAGVTEKEQLIRLVDADEVRANLPLSGGVLSGKLKASLERGSTLDIALALVGKKTSSRRDVARGDMKGECEGATHFVRSAIVGAFVMRTGTRAKAAAAADLLAGSASGLSSSEEQIENRDGSVEACRTADASSEAPPARCASPIRLQLRAIGTSLRAVAASTDDAPRCAPGLVPFDDGKCGKRTAEVAYICGGSDAAECEQQCNRGSLASCTYLGKGLRAKAPDAAAKLFERACEGGVAEGCGRLGEMRTDVKLLQQACKGGWFPGCTAAGALALEAGAKVDVVAAFKRGCQGGNADDCWGYGSVFSIGFLPPNDAEQLRAFQRACEGGARLGCSSLAEMYDRGKGVEKDPARAVTLLRSSCDRGFSSSCAGLSAHYFSGAGVEKDPAAGVALLTRACEGDERGSCFPLAMRYQAGLGVTRDETKARAYFVRACEGGIEPACDEAKR